VCAVVDDRLLAPLLLAAPLLRPRLLQLVRLRIQLLLRAR
jgi:hypothetical protein